MISGVGRVSDLHMKVGEKIAKIGEIRLSPGIYEVQISHPCYENMSFQVGIQKGKYEVFDRPLLLKEGALVLSVLSLGEPQIVPIWINGKKVGNSPWSGKVPVCASIEVGAERRQTVMTTIRDHEVTQYTYEISKSSGTKLSAGKGADFTFIDQRDGQEYKATQIGNQIWMAQNLNYETDSSLCYDNDLGNCKKYGRLYTWPVAMIISKNSNKAQMNWSDNMHRGVCPEGWHIPNNREWLKLQSYIQKAENAPFDFTTDLGGQRDNIGKFIFADKSAYFWSATDNGWGFAGFWKWSAESKTFSFDNSTFIKIAMSVRCVKDTL